MSEYIVQKKYELLYFNIIILTRRRNKHQMVAIQFRIRDSINNYTSQKHQINFTHTLTTIILLFLFTENYKKENFNTT